MFKNLKIKNILQLQIDKSIGFQEPLEISQRENNFKESDICYVFPLEDDNLVQLSPPLKKQCFDFGNEIMISSTQTLESAVSALKNRENELETLSTR